MLDQELEQDSYTEDFNAEDEALFNQMADEAEGRITEEEPEDEPEEEIEEAEESDADPDEDEHEEPDAEEAPEEGAPREESVQELRSRLASLEQERDTWRHKYQSDEGRFRAAQQRLHELDNLKRQLQNEQPQNRQQQEQSQIAQAGVDAIKAGKFTEFKQDFPEMAEALEEYMGVHSQQILQRFEQELAPLKTAHQQQLEELERQRFQSAADQLAAIHPDWQEYNRDTNDDFRHWLFQQSEGIQSLYGKPDVQAARALIDLYKHDTKQAQPAPDSAASRAEQVVAQRQKKLERSSVPQTRRGSASVEDSDDAEWNAMAAKIDRKFLRQR